MKGKLCELRVLQNSEEEVRAFTDSINAGWTTQHLFTGSIPMRYIDVEQTWDDRRKAGCVEFGIWVPDKLKEWKFVGTTGLYSKRDIYRSYEFQIIIFDPGSVSRGVGTEATRLVVNYGFSRLNAHKVWLGVNEDNERAIRCYEKVGFVKEGKLRDEIWAFGKYHNGLRYSILENEWASLNEIIST